ncbi:hypothetical protein LTR84_003785 [Exophiala bonariae]|uniref:SMP-30/Gluconolactonase/LRE-like region domain-containing protein n=1 Tax=Exophiala bonariae TaxID=1690606 RepID=A0AAV9N6Z6_9EURO|nr:hypothetical protein LTR84_003785 [Exophiala bonariae]
MPNTRGSKVTLPLITVALAVIIYTQSEFLWKLIGQANIDKSRLVKWENSEPLNNGNCQVIKEMNACEDVKIHYASNTAFLACGDPLERRNWYPCAGMRDSTKRSEASFRETLFKYDLISGKPTELQLHGLEGDFITHGIDIFSTPGDPSKVHIFAVNHAREGDSILIFSHELGSDVVELESKVRHPNIKTANGVVATGSREFYVTNDHYFALGPLRVAEEAYGPFTWSTHVQFCDASAEHVTCKQVTGTFPGANGIALWKNRLFVGDARNGTVTIFDIHHDKSLTQLSQMDLGAAADNINIDPISGDPIVAIFPTLEDLPTYLDNVLSLGKDFLVPAASLRLNHAKDYAPELIYFDDGSVMSFMTTAAVDPYNNLFLASGVIQYGGLAVCQVPAGTFA